MIYVGLIGDYLRGFLVLRTGARLTGLFFVVGILSDCPTRSVPLVEMPLARANSLIGTLYR
jgi:hypothetical protein